MCSISYRRTLLFVLAITFVRWQVCSADFTLREHIGHDWTNECVTFPLTPDQADKVGKELALVSSDGKQIAYQMLVSEGRLDKRICFQADLPPLETREFQFSDTPATARLGHWRTLRQPR
jgi:hypothetical protein